MADNEKGHAIHFSLPIAVSFASLLISLGTFVFQYCATQSQQRISTAIEFSKLYLADKEISQRYGMVVFADDPITAKDKVKFLEARSYVDLIEYISHLINARLADSRYIATRIKCDIAYVRDTIVSQHPDLSDATDEMKRYVEMNRENLGCPSRVRSR